jgi:hypothetical protein
MSVEVTGMSDDRDRRVAGDRRGVPRLAGHRARPRSRVADDVGLLPLLHGSAAGTLPSCSGCGSGWVGTCSSGVGPSSSAADASSLASAADLGLRDLRGDGRRRRPETVRRPGRLGDKSAAKYPGHLIERSSGGTRPSSPSFWSSTRGSRINPRRSRARSWVARSCVGSHSSWRHLVARRTTPHAPVRQRARR